MAGRLCGRLLGRCFALPPRSPCPRGSRKTAPVSPRVSNSAPPASRPVDGMGLYDATGARKYLTRSERDAFLTADRVDLAAGLLVFETLKKRRSGVYRSVPVPPARLPRPGAWHPRAPGPPRQRTQPSPLAVVTHDRLACRPRRHAGSRPSPAPTPPSRASATASPPSPPGSPSTSSRNGSDTPSSPPPPSTPTPPEPRKKISPAKCGNELLRQATFSISRRTWTTGLTDLSGSSTSSKRSAGPDGRFTPRSHWVTEDLSTPSNRAKTS